MPVSILIVEDEFIIAEDIRLALLANGYELFGIANSYEEAIELLQTGDLPDFALLDITLGDQQWGLKLGKMLSQELKIPFIYVTSHSDSGTIEKVKETKPSGYLLKPFNRESIYASIEVALAAHNAQKNNLAETRAFYLKQGVKKIRIPYSDILFMEADGNYTQLYTTGPKYTERKKIGEILEEMEDHPFVRVHKSFVINKDKIRHTSREKVVIGDHEIPVGRTYLDELNLL